MPSFYFRFFGWSLLMLASLLWSTHAAMDLLPKQPNVEQLPIYPHAQHVQITSPQLVGFVYRSISSFDTVDSPDRVLAFYQDELIDTGWQPRFNKNDTRIRLGFILRGCPYYYLGVRTSQPRLQKTHVEVQLIKAVCR
jgi:hypothetical protein